MAEFLRRHLWTVFLAHQLLIFVTAVGFLTLVRRTTGRSVHGGRDPVGLLDGAALVGLSIGSIFFTRALYRWVKGGDAPPLGIALSPRRFVDLIAGLLVGFIFVILPYLLGLLRGTAFIHDRLSAHFDFPAAFRVICIAIFLLLLQAMMEETANRAFPMRLWEHRSIWFRLLVPSVFFAALHLADEQFGIDRFGILLMAGVLHGLAYLLTGNIWLTAGLHAGANYAAFSVSGLWHAGAVVSITGRPTFPNWVAALLLLGVLSAAFLLSHRREINGRPLN